MKKVPSIRLSVRAIGKLAMEALHGFTSLLKKIPKGFNNCSFLNGFGAAAEVAALQSKQYKLLSSLRISKSYRIYLIHTQTNNMKKGQLMQVWVNEEENEDGNQTVINDREKQEVKRISASVTECPVEM